MGLPERHTQTAGSQSSFKRPPARNVVYPFQGNRLLTTVYLGCDARPFVNALRASVEPLHMTYDKSETVIELPNKPNSRLTRWRFVLVLPSSP